ncbi:type VI secretion system Vgr family protein [Metapseudomonas boanensis]|uniref:Type VI secretion system tip protein VgrG n=1 Tax=Metapseudomonas boanensis TaxID=2822138 RepID=A0ABS5XL71_9GAMM|nr:type VI secretion system Vgr family protein [Pseudomonas boanensis]MBT8768446.1 type VI secretion system tip protein VgrG [Pseudomonas boanensis]
MLDALQPFFDHSRHKLQVRGLDAALDVLAFRGEEALSQPFLYRVEFTSTQRDLPADQLLSQDARFSLFPPPTPVPFAGMSVPPAQPLRTLHGVVTGFRRLSGSHDEAHYEITLQPRLALLGCGKQYRIYQNLSVPEIVETIFRSDRHHWAGQDFVFDLKREYPKREQVMQYGESDLAFIQRLLAEVGIWYRFIADERLGIEVVEFHDDQRHYQFDVQLPYRPQSGTSSSGQDAVWHLQSRHGVVEKHVHIRAYTPRDAAAYLDGGVNQTRGDRTTHGEAYHYAEPYTELGDPYAQDEDLQSESGYFYARLSHERYLNQQTRLGGRTSSAALAPGQVLKVDGGAPEAFAPGAVITHVTTTAARDRSFEARFTAIPYAENICFRPPLLPKPVIAGTIPARITSPQTGDLYSHIDLEGRYKVNFLFDRDTWPAGHESLWLRLARPYAGDTYGLHLPLIQGTEVGIAFEHGDPDRGFIAFALHDSRHPDLVTLKNYKRNVLRTLANNKLRLDDTRGQEHIKLSTEHSGKSQLNLGHLVDAQRQERGAGFELRTDGQGAVRAGKGLFISADQQPRAQGQVLAMQEAVARLQQAGEEMQKLSTDAQAAQADPADVQAQLAFMRERVDQLKAAVALLSAPQGIALTSGNHLQLAAERNLIANAGNDASVSVAKRLFIGVGEGVSLFVRKLGLKLIANQGAVQIQAQNDRLELLARHGLDIVSSEDEIRITAKKKITLNAGGSYITLDPYRIESGTQGDYLIKAVHFDYQGPASMTATHPEYPKLASAPRLRLRMPQAPNAPQAAWTGMPYTLYADGAPLQQGVLDETGYLTFEHQVVTRHYRLELANGLSYQLPVPSEYRNPEQGELANRGLHNHPSQASDGIPHTEQRVWYAALLEKRRSKEGDNA